MVTPLTSPRTSRFIELCPPPSPPEFSRNPVAPPESAQNTQSTPDTPPIPRTNLARAPTDHRISHPELNISLDTILAEHHAWMSRPKRASMPLFPHRDSIRTVSGGTTSTTSSAVSAGSSQISRSNGNTARTSMSSERTGSVSKLGRNLSLRLRRKMMPYGMEKEGVVVEESESYDRAEKADNRASVVEDPAKMAPRVSIIEVEEKSNTRRPCERKWRRWVAWMRKA